ncbi:spermatid-specific manchette-related protein 1 [Falco biarmicus]|uniref:spermatid-specific manchette-related protein 1 n=1 Tax=Falco biarmicus TaxID=345155 RepID=UPI0024BC2246|nr:spermatid-specific manchette-related protein 1 [Falco biarmicus]
MLFKKTIQEQAPQQLWKENKFVTKGLTMPLVQNPASQGQPKQLVKATMQEYYRNTGDLAAYWPDVYWLARSKVTIAKKKHNSFFVNENEYITRRTSLYNSTASSYPSCSCACAILESIWVMVWLPLLALTLPIPSLSEGEVVADMAHRLPVYTVIGRGPSQGYYSPCPGHRYCLQGLSYSIDGVPANRRHLHTLGERAVRSMPCCSYSPRAMFWTSTHHLQPSSLCRSPTYRWVQWDTSHFKMTGGVQ